MSAIAIMFARLVEEGRRDFHTEVPGNLKPEVKEILISKGLGHLTE